MPHADLNSFREEYRQIPWRGVPKLKDAEIKGIFDDIDEQFRNFSAPNPKIDHYGPIREMQFFEKIFTTPKFLGKLHIKGLMAFAFSLAKNTDILAKNEGIGLTISILQLNEELDLPHSVVEYAEKRLRELGGKRLKMWPNWENVKFTAGHFVKRWLEEGNNNPIYDWYLGKSVPK